MDVPTVPTVSAGGKRVSYGLRGLARILHIVYLLMQSLGLTVWVNLAVLLLQRIVASSGGRELKMIDVSREEAAGRTEPRAEIAQAL